MGLSRRQRLFKIVLRHLCFEAALQMLPHSGAADGILWNNPSKYFLGSEFVGWLLKHTFYQCSPFEKPSEQLQNYSGESRAGSKVQTVDTSLPL